jgi:hypothetical protein
VVPGYGLTYAETSASFAVCGICVNRHLRIEQTCEAVGIYQLRIPIYD